MSIHSKGRQFFTNFPTMSHVIAATTSLNDRTTGASLGIFWKPLVSFLDGSTWQAGFQAEAPNTQQPVFLLGWSGHLFVDYQNSMAIKVCICNVYIKYIYIWILAAHFCCSQSTFLHRFDGGFFTRQPTGAKGGIPEVQTTQPQTQSLPLINLW